MNSYTILKAQLRQIGLHPCLDRLIAEFEQLQWRTGYTGQFAVMKNGVLTLSLWTGVHKVTRRKTERSTLFPVLSATKGLASMAMLRLHHLGYFDWNDQICQYWPDFGKNGKHCATVADALAHCVGLTHLTADWRHWSDRQYMTRLVEEARPEWVPGSQYGYHGGSWGVIVDELVRRWTGGETGEVLRTLAPEGVDLRYLGLPPERCGDVAQLDAVEPDEGYNSMSVLMSCQSSGGGVATAEELAVYYNILAHTGSLSINICWSRDEQTEATTPQNDVEHEQPMARPELRFSWGMGFMVPPSQDVYGWWRQASVLLGTPVHQGL
jgi:CubicO group peptidase (beta-lactamase class C family)